MPYLKIDLLSDMCVSNGESFSSTIDIDISYDLYGLPIIKAKNLKGCLREIAEEFEDISAVPIGFTDDVFGNPGSTLPSLLKIQNAHPSNYNMLIADIQNNKLSQESVRSCYTYTRGQTSIDKETGTAKKETLRNIRVLKRGLSFLCEYSIDEKYANDFKKCIKALRFIGINRTRGLGEVRCTPVNDAVERSSENNIVLNENEYIEYIIHTLSPVIPSMDCKTNYIPASSVIGLCFNELGNDKMLEILNDEETIFTNAYISDGKNQFCINPAFLAKQKEADYKDSKMPVYVFDTEKCNTADPPALALKGVNLCISSDFSSLNSIPIIKEINYHHKQSQTNPGTVDGVNFYQLPSFSANQFFIGRIYGSKSSLNEIAHTFGKTSYHNIGYYRSGGYGYCQITLKKETVNSYSPVITDTLSVWLNAPVILYDENGMPCAKPQIFADYFNDILQKIGTSIKTNSDGSYSIIAKYLNYTDIGGYNSVWGMNKPVIRAYESGTVFIFELNNKIDITKLYNLSVGERINEGYGEFKVFDYKAVQQSANVDLSIFKLKNAQTAISYLSPLSTDPWKLPSETIAFKENCNRAVAAALENYQLLTSQYSLNASSVGRLNLMLQESNDYTEFCNKVKSIKDTKKKQKAIKWIDLNYNGCHISEDFYLEYFTALFQQAKYSLRRNDV